MIITLTVLAIFFIKATNKMFRDPELDKKLNH